MELSTTTMCQSKDQFLLLKEQQSLVKEGSAVWHDLQSQINQIVAERFLRYVNR